MAYTAAAHQAAQRDEARIDSVADLRHLAKVLRWAARHIEADAEAIVSFGLAEIRLALGESAEA